MNKCYDMMAVCSRGMAGKDVTVFLNHAYVEGKVGTIGDIQKDLSIAEAERLIMDLQHAIHTATSLILLEGMADESYKSISRGV